MAHLSQEQLRRLAQLGAKARLEQLKAEETAIRSAFPELFGRGRREQAANGQAAAGRRQRPAMSAAGRRAVSQRMKKYWAERRKAKGK